MNIWWKKIVTAGLVVLMVIAAVLGTSCRLETSNMEFIFNSLPTLEHGHYEAWVVFGEEWVSLGKFGIPISMIPLTVTSTRDLSKSDFVEISIEPEGDTDDMPSGIIVLSCCVVQSVQANLEFPIFLIPSKGNYVLATPSDGEYTNETSGIWFLKLPSPLPLVWTCPSYRKAGCMKVG